MSESEVQNMETHKPNLIWFTVYKLIVTNLNIMLNEN